MIKIVRRRRISFIQHFHHGLRLQKCYEHIFLLLDMQRLMREEGQNWVVLWTRGKLALSLFINIFLLWFFLKADQFSSEASKLV